MLLLNLMTTGKLADGQNPIYETKARKYLKEFAAAVALIGAPVAAFTRTILGPRPAS